MPAIFQPFVFIVYGAFVLARWYTDAADPFDRPYYPVPNEYLRDPIFYKSYYPAPETRTEPESVARPYSFEYSVNDPETRDVKSQREDGDGRGNVKGYYSLLEADGTTRIVEYSANEHSGFNAVVTKKASNEGYEPAYQPRTVSEPNRYKLEYQRKH